MREPAKYFTNNFAGSLSLLDAMVQAGVKHIVFSSTAAVYGDVQSCRFWRRSRSGGEPYGESKVMVETLLRWFDRIHGITSVWLRYFNASGADPEAALGEEHEPETHLIPLVLRAVNRAVGDGVRRGLSDARRHLHPRLHPRQRSGARAYSRARVFGEWRAIGVQCGHGAGAAFGN